MGNVVHSCGVVERACWRMTCQHHLGPKAIAASGESCALDVVALFPGGLEQAEIAHVLGCTPQSVQKVEARALMKLGRRDTLATLARSAGLPGLPVHVPEPPKADDAALAKLAKRRGMLPARWRVVLAARLRVNGQKRKTVAALAAELGVSPQRVTQIEAKARAYLARRLAA